ncbi:MAG TPA: efflux RND transporter periplasmic adaptor subunit [Acidiferrobacteraceae bacterium]|nr:efflux RND transporter periplasmic adaptor subunit [Acidiferrobacteraceae bacterium]HEX19647.1 efflux RND transporter periplasmic adaptor subunit [Acidiferrobacteraceae bacterium]
MIFGNNKAHPIVAIPNNKDQKPVLGIPSGGDFKRIDCLIEPDKVVDVASSTAGVINSINVERGDIVKKGAVLAVLENGVERTNVKLAAARLKFAKENYTRMEALYKKKVVSLQEKDKSHTELQVAILELRRAKEMLQKRVITSPLSGIVVQRYISPGEITDQQKVLKIATINPLKVEVVAPIKLLGTMRKGMNAQIWPEGPHKGPFLAKVTIVDRVVDAASGTFGVRLSLPNPGHKIPAGVKCEAGFSGQATDTASKR